MLWMLIFSSVILRYFYTEGDDRMGVSALSQNSGNSTQGFEFSSLAQGPPNCSHEHELLLGYLGSRLQPQATWAWSRRGPGVPPLRGNIVDNGKEKRDPSGATVSGTLSSSDGADDEESTRGRQLRAFRATRGSSDNLPDVRNMDTAASSQQHERSTYRRRNRLRTGHRT